MLTKIHIAKAMVFPVVIYGCESWTIKKVEHRKIDAFIYLFIYFLIGKLMLLNCGAGEDSRESLGQQGD